MPDHDLREACYGAAMGALKRLSEVLALCAVAAVVVVLQFGPLLQDREPTHFDEWRSVAWAPLLVLGPIASHLAYQWIGTSHRALSATRSLPRPSLLPLRRSGRGLAF